MKHVFIAHSHTLWLTAVGTIEYLRLDLKDVIVLCTRNYSLPDHIIDVKGIQATPLFNECDVCVRSLRHNKQLVKKVDGFVEECIGENYCLYIPHFWDLFFRLLYTHKKCVKASLVQEGAYIGEEYFKCKTSIYAKLKNYIYSLVYFGSLRNFHCAGWYEDGVLTKQEHIDVFGLDDNFFKYMPQGITRFNIVKWPKYQGDLSLEHYDAPIFIFDGYVKNGVVEKDVYLDCCKSIIKKYHGDYNYIKYHPAQATDERMMIRNLFTDLGIVVQELGNQPFEFYLTKFDKLRIVGFTSSLLFFAQNQGHIVDSGINELHKSQKFSLLYKTGFFNEFVNLLKIK